MTEKESSGKKKLVDALEKYELSFEEKYLPEDMEVEFSKQYEVYMEKLLSGKISKRRKYFNTVGKRIAACVAAIVIIFGGSMTVKAFREPVVEFFTNVYEKIVEIFFDDDDIAKAPSEIETVYTLGYVPAGYKYDNIYLNESFARTIWNNGENQIVFCQYVFYGKSLFDNENSDYTCFYLGETKIAVIEKNDKKTLFWNSDKYSFKLILPVDFSEEDVSKIISSIMKKD